MTLLGKAGIKDDLKKEMLYNFTNGRTESVRELSSTELEQFCKELTNKVQYADLELLVRKKRSIALTLATITGIKEVYSWKKFNDWMLKSSVYKKELHAYDYTELDDLIKQFRALETNYNNSAEKFGTKAWHHATGIPKTSIN